MYVCVCACVCVEPALTHSYNNDSGSRVDEQLILTVKREKGRRAELTAASPSHNSSVAHQAVTHLRREKTALRSSEPTVQYNTGRLSTGQEWL